MQKFFLLTLFAAVCYGQHLGSDKLDMRVNQHSNDILGLVKTSFEESVANLFKSYRYKDQSMEKPGMAKLYKEQSDQRYDQGVKILKKFLERGGMIRKASLDNLALSVTSTESTPAALYSTDLENIKKTSEDIVKSFNKMHYELSHGKTQARKKYYDAELAHFFEEALEDETSNLRKLSVIWKEFKDMATDKVAAHLYDEHLA